MARRTLSGFRFAQIRQDDSLPEIAARELLDASRWPELVAINALVPPFLTGSLAELRPGVKLYGETLLIPAAAPQVSAEVDPDLVFGVDLELRDGLLVAGEGGDLAVVRGRDNLRQALVHRLRTPLRGLLRHLRYGCGVYALKGKVVGPTAGDLGVRFVRDALGMEKRLSSVGQVAADLAGDSVEIKAIVQPIAGAPVSVTTARS